MANRITNEEIERINELYVEIGVKSKVAAIVGRSPATVSKYIIQGYVPKSQRIEITCDVKPLGCNNFLTNILSNLEGGDTIENRFVFFTKLTNEEKKDLDKLRKEIF